MVITEIQLNFTSPEIAAKDSILAFVKIIFDGCFAVRDIKLIERDGYAYLGMPSRKAVAPCWACHKKIGANDNYCFHCGKKVVKPETQGKNVYVDISHPVTNSFRQYLEDQIVAHYNVTIKDPKLHLKVKRQNNA